uniref:Uncharacterized protein n=1 Tax=Rhizophora mucronata TaxID=61149 RepID=A0A2P2PNB1_RHIMU
MIIHPTTHGFLPQLMLMKLLRNKTMEEYYKRTEKGFNGYQQMVCLSVSYAS